MRNGVARLAEHDVSSLRTLFLAGERLDPDTWEDPGRLERLVYVPYVRPGFPLARAVSELAGRIPAGALGLALAALSIVIGSDIGLAEAI